MIDVAVVGLITAPVIMLTQLFKWQGLPDRWGPIAVIAFSALGVGLWAWSEGTMERASVFALFNTAMIVALSAAGVFGFTRAGSTAITATKAPPSGGAGSDKTV